MRILYIVAFFCLVPFLGWSQINQIKVVGNVIDRKVPAMTHSVMVVNKTTGMGKFGNADGSFEIICNKTDSLYISARGYAINKLSFQDSSLRPEYTILLELSDITYQLKQVTIFPERELNEIKSDIDKLGYNAKDYKISGIDAVESPITFLYQTFNKHEQKKRLAVELENEYNRRQLLKELFAKYVKHDIIDLENDRFDDFIDFCQLSDIQMKRLSQYDFIMYVKDKYKMFSILKSEDYYYENAK